VTMVPGVSLVMGRSCVPSSAPHTSST
jgi:hypothetical protein